MIDARCEAFETRVRKRARCTPASQQNASRTRSASGRASLRASWLRSCCTLYSGRGDPMTDRIPLIKDEAIPGYGSFEVRFPTIGRANSFTGTISQAPGSGRKRWIEKQRLRTRGPAGTSEHSWGYDVARLMACELVPWGKLRSGGTHEVLPSHRYIRLDPVCDCRRHSNEYDRGRLSGLTHCSRCHQASLLPDSL